MTQSENLKLAQRGACLSLIVYIVLSVAKYITGYMYDSAAVRTGVLNNMADIVVSIAVIMGLKISIEPADRSYPYGHLKSENISTLLVSFIIMFVGIQAVIENTPRILTNEQHIPNFITIIISMMGGVIMIDVYAINHRLAKQIKNSSLNSASKDNLSDGLVSISTAIELLFTQFDPPIIDVILAIVLGCLTIYTGFGISKGSVFTLSDGFKEQDLEECRNLVQEVTDVREVKKVKGRYHGSSISLDVTIVVDTNLSLQEAHDICGRVETHLENNGISSVYVHPEPNTLNEK